MSLDISIANKKTNDSRGMNWLRNPFGLCNWAEDNVSPKTKKSLWYICNNWNYDKSGRVNRKLFKNVVDAYWKEIKWLKRGYFVFDVYNYVQFVQPHLDLMPTEKILDFEYIKGQERKNDKLGIPMEHFKHSAFNLGHCDLRDYKNWFKELVEFAKLLQDKRYSFYCSN